MPCVKRGAFYYCLRCVPSAASGEPAEADLKTCGGRAGTSVVGRFSEKRAYERHAAKCGSGAEEEQAKDEEGIKKQGAHWYCLRCFPSAAAGVPEGEGSASRQGGRVVGRFSRRGDAIQHAKTCGKVPARRRCDLELPFWKTAMQEKDAFKKVNRPPVIAERLCSETPVGGCAACGCIVVGEAEKFFTDRMPANKAFAYESGAAPPVGSSRGFREHKGVLLRLIKKLVTRDRACNRYSFSLCENCARLCKKNASFDKVACSLDLGDVSDLPELTLAEKASIAMTRVYGHLIKVQMNQKEAPFKLTGHCISFDQDVRSAAGKIFPRTDVGESIKVQFIGGLENWKNAIPILKGNARAPLTVRKDVIAAWLDRLCKTHPLYRDAIVDPEAFRQLEENVDNIIKEAIVSEDRATLLVDLAMQSDIAGNAFPEMPEGAPQPQANEALISDVVVQNQNPKHEERRRLQETAASLRIDASTVPMNEFDANDVIIGGAFPWVFPCGISGRIDAARRKLIVTQFDDRVSHEPSLLFLLFNQMQRHRVTHNIARATKEQLELVEELRKAEDFEARVKDALSDTPTEEGMRLRRLLLGSIHRAEKRVPFSRSEMDSAYVELLAMLRFFGSPTFFLTISPTVVDNAFGLKISFGRDGAHKEEYAFRSKLVFQTPVRSAIFFETMMRHIEERLLVLDGSAPGVFGTIRAASRTNECQGRTLLHAHMLLWTEVTPELVQQLYRKGKEDLLQEIFSFFEKVVTTKMPSEFHLWSDNLWKEKVRPPDPGREEDCPAPLWSTVHKHLLHRFHHQTCWSKFCGNEKPTDRCRMACPAGRWDLPTQLIRVTCDLRSGEATPILSPDPASIPCAHVFDCDCREYDQLLAVTTDPVIVELNRPTVQDQIVCNFTEDVLRAVWSNTNTSIISTSEQASVVALYQIKYNSKNKFSLANALASLIAARKNVSKKTGETTERTFWNCFVNSAACDHEVPATMAAFALIGGKGFETTCSFWFVFPWDSVDRGASRAEEALQDGSGDEASDTEPEEEAQGENETPRATTGDEEDDDDYYRNTIFDDEGVPMGRFDDWKRSLKRGEAPAIRPYQQEKFPTEGGECSGHRVFEVDGKPVAVSQEEVYLARPDALQEIGFLAFSCMYDVEEFDPDGNDEGAMRNRRFYLKSTLAIYKSYRLRERSSFPIPVLGGSAPPMLPQRNDTKRSGTQREAWASYWATLLMPWRVKEDLRQHDAKAMLEWLFASLRGENGTCEKMRALFVVNVSIKWRHIKRHCLILNAWRFRAAHTREYAERAQLMKRNAFATGNAECDTKAISHGELLASVVRFVNAGGFEDEPMRRRIVQLDSFFPVASDPSAEGAADARGRSSLVVVDSRSADDVAKKIDAFDEPIFNVETRIAQEEGQAKPIAPQQETIVPPDPSLNDGQNHLRSKVLASILDGKRELIFVQGEAGTGKSHVIRAVARDAALLAGCGPNTVRCVSPTGVAAENLLKGTMTIHKAFGINPKNTGATAEPLRGEALTAFLARFRGTRVFIIDEISMVSPSLFMKVEARLVELADAERTRYVNMGNRKAAEQINRNVAFGGFTVVVMGDFRQIPPVGATSLLKIALDFHGSCAHAGYLWRKFKMIPLTEQCRANEPGQQERVKTLRSGKITKELLDGIARLTPSEATSTFKNASYLVKTNKERVAVNTMRAANFAKERGVPVIKWKNELHAGLASIIDDDLLVDICNMTPDLTSTFVEGAPAMILRNVNPQCGMSNGSYCEMVGLAGLSAADQIRIEEAAAGQVIELSIPPTHVLVKVDALSTDTSAPRLSIGGVQCVPLDLVSGEVEVSGQKLGYRSHHVTLAFAVTMHKVQGKTLDKAVIMLSNHGPQWKPTFEQFLVAVTRVRRAEDLRIMPSLSETDRFFYSLTELTPNEDVTEWFGGKFDPDGYRIYEEPLAKESSKATGARKGATRGRKQQQAATATTAQAPAQPQPQEQPQGEAEPDTAQPPTKKGKRQNQEARQQKPARATKRQREAEPTGERQREAPHSTTAPHEETQLAILESMFSSGAPLLDYANSLSMWLSDLESEGAFVEEDLVTALLTNTVGQTIPFVHRLHQWWNLETPVFASIFCVPNHFAAMLVDLASAPPTVTIADSLPQYTNAHPEEKIAAMDLIRARIAELTGVSGEAVVFKEKNVPRQSGNNCALETITNNLSFMFPNQTTPRVTRRLAIRVLKKLAAVGILVDLA